MHLRSVVGVVELQVWHGKDPHDGHWGSPVRERWGLPAHQQMSPALEEKLAFTATLAGSYAAAGQLAAKWGSAVDDAVIHALVQRVGSKAEAQMQERLEQLPQESQPQRRDSELAVLMMEGRRRAARSVRRRRSRAVRRGRAVAAGAGVAPFGGTGGLGGAGLAATRSK